MDDFSVSDLTNEIPFPLHSFDFYPKWETHTSNSTLTLSERYRKPDHFHRKHVNMWASTFLFFVFSLRTEEVVHCTACKAH